MEEAFALFRPAQSLLLFVQQLEPHARVGEHVALLQRMRLVGDGQVHWIHGTAVLSNPKNHSTL